MNDRQRFLATMHYRPRDRAPICDLNFWDETLVAWQGQGLPPGVDRNNSDDYFGMDPLFRCVLDTEAVALTTSADPGRSMFEGVFVGLIPEFDTVVLEDRGDAQLIQQPDGVRVLKGKSMSSIPLHEGHLLVDRGSWKEHYLPRLDPADPRRYPKNWDACVAFWRDESRQLPLFLPGGSLYGWLRNWMGLEGVSMALYDDPAWFEEMVTAVADCVIGVLGRVLGTGGRFDGCSLWEDMCYKSGPLLGPEHFKRYLVPHYRRLTDLLHRHGVDVIWVDSDGKIDDLVPLWLEAGVNCMIPIEVGTWKASPLAFRREYGRDMRMIGGVDKHVIPRGEEAIREHLAPLVDLAAEGGYVPLPDHRIPPHCSLEQFRTYVRVFREMFGTEAISAKRLAAGVKNC